MSCPLHPTLFSLTQFKHYLCLNVSWPWHAVPCGKCALGFSRFVARPLQKPTPTLHVCSPRQSRKCHYHLLVLFVLLRLLFSHAGFGTRRPAQKARSVVWKKLKMRQKRVWQSPLVRHSTDGGTSDIDLCTVGVLTHLSMPTHPIAVCDHMFPLFGCQPIYCPQNTTVSIFISRPCQVAESPR